MSRTRTGSRSDYHLEDETRLIEVRWGEIGSRERCKLVVPLPAPERDSEDARTLPEEVHHDFEYRAQHARTELGRLLRRSLEAEGNYGVLPDGLLLIGWVALWRPVEIFLYHWWPIRRRQRRFEAIARMPVKVR